MVTMGEDGDDVEFVPLATTIMEQVVPVVNTLLLAVLKLIVVLDCPEEVPVITDPPPEEGVAVAVYDNAPVTEEKVTVVCVEEEEEAVTFVGAAKGVMVTIGKD